MTLEEEITKLDLIASDAFEGGDANEFRQLAEWLRELEKYRESWEHLFATIFEIKSNAENEDVRNLANFLLKYMRIYEKEIREVNADESNPNMGKA